MIINRVKFYFKKIISHFNGWDHNEELIFCANENIKNGLYQIPIFIISFNRLNYLYSLIAQLEKRNYHNIFIIDNKSTYKPLLEYYKSINHKVFYLDKNYGHLVFWKLDIFKEYRKDFYVVTDPDLQIIDECPDDFMSKFFEIAIKYPFVKKVGFSLKIDDLPDNNKMKRDVLKWEKKFYSTYIKKDNCYYGHYKKISYLLHILAKPIIKNAKYRCACSSLAAKWMFNTYNNVIGIRNGVDIDRFSFNKEKRNEIRDKFKIDNKKIVIGSISDFSYSKNPEFIFELVQKFKNNPQYAFLFIGNTENCELAKWVQKDKSINNVIFIGQVTNTQDYLSAMDIFILPSRFEGLPMCALEAQVSGLYTMISDTITPDTKCSTYFKQLPLNQEIWVKNIIDFQRKDRERDAEFLMTEEASSKKTASMFRKIYTGEI